MALSRTDQFVKSTTGQAISGAHLYWLTQPATVPSTEQQGGPTPQATLFTDTTGATTLPQPVVTDGFGHAAAYMAPGLYTLAVYNSGSLVATYPDQGIGVGGGVNSLNGLSGPVTLQAGTGIGITVVGSSIILSAASVSVFVNGTALSSSSSLNLQSGTGATVTDNGGANVSYSPLGSIDPSQTLSVLWTPTNAANGDWTKVNDAAYYFQDSGATAQLNVPTLTTNGSLAITGTRMYGGTPKFYGGRNITYKAVVESVNNIANASISTFGLCDNANTVFFNFPVGYGGTSVIALSAGVTTWTFVVGNGTTYTTVSTSLSIGTRYFIEIDYTPTSVVLKANGSVVTTVTTNLPTAASLGLLFYQKANGGSPGPVLTVEYMYCTQASV